MGPGKIALPKRIGWPLLVFLVFWDAFLTYSAGVGEGNPLWKPFVDVFGLNFLWVLAVLVLVLSYFVVRLAGMYVNRSDNMVRGEGVVLTTLVIAFGVYDFYITFLLPYFGFLGTRSHYAIIPFIIIPVFIYNVWVEYKRRRIKE